jgi:tetratricopeptide (TPR) repeat protein
MRTTRALLLTAVASLAVLAGCTRTIPIRSLRPGPISLGAVRDLVILDGHGRRSARELVYLEMAHQARTGAYFSLRDRSEDGIEVQIAGRRAIVYAETPGLEPGEAGLRVDVVEWITYRDLEDVERRREDGTRYLETVHTFNADVVLSVSLFDDSGRTVIAEREYYGGYSTEETGISRDEILELAAQEAVYFLFADITPRHVTTRVRLDDDDPGQEFILETARAGNVAQAAAEARLYAKLHPLNPGAAYNLAVLLDAMGEYAEALAMYDEALSLGNKSYYVGARAGCAQRLAAQQSLSDEAM